MAESTAESSGVLFREEQRMDLRLTLIVCFMAVLGIVVFWVTPHEGLPDFARPVVLGFMFFLAALTIAFMFIFYLQFRLVTEARENGLSLRCRFVFRGSLDVPLDNVVSHKVASASSTFALAWQHRQKMTARVILDESLLRLKKRRVWVVRGSHGVRIDYGDGTFFLIGSQQPEQLNEVIGRLLVSRASSWK